MSGPLSRTVVRRLGRLALAAAILAGSASTVRAAEASYPSSRALADVAAWVQRDTPLKLGQIVDISPQAVTAITAASPMGQTRGFLANISSEALDPAMLDHDGIASWSIPVEVDCDRRVVRLGVMTGYRGRDLMTEARKVRDADADWVNPTPSAPLGSVIRALCDRDFHRPLMGKFKTVARATEPKAGPPPVIEVRPRKVASAAPKSAPDGAVPAPTAPAAEAPAAAPVSAPVRTPKPPQSIPIPGASVTAEARPPPEPKPVARLKPPPGGGPVTLQIGASPSLPDTQALLARFKKRFGGELGGLKSDIATVQVEGKTVNRALISGFASNAEANAYCKTLAAAGQACFIRH